MEIERRSTPTRTDTQDPLIEIEGLRVGFPEAEDDAPIIEDLNLTIRIGEIVALVGESGSGKSMTALSLMRLLPAEAAVLAGRVRIRGENILDMSAAQLNELRGGRIGMIFQQPHAMLDPTSRVGGQVAESARLHRHLGHWAAKARVVELLREVGIPEPEARARCFAHQLSGGMAQRVMIATALSGDPELLIADEPTTALDVTVQAQILKLIDEERRRRGLAVLLITHDLTVVSALADRVAVMYAGRIVEEGPTEAILHHPQHPYTQALVRCSLLQADDTGALFSIPGGTALARDLQCGCRFLPRCATARARGLSERCTISEPAMHDHGGGCTVRCWAAEPLPPSPSTEPSPHHAGA